MIFYLLSGITIGIYIAQNYYTPNIGDMCDKVLQIIKDMEKRK